MRPLTRFPRAIAALLVSIVAMFIVAGCSSDTSPASGSGSLEMYMTDAPSSYDSVVIVVTRVEVHAANNDSTSGWIVVRADSARYDLLTLRNGARAIMDSGGLAPGHYTQIRLVLGAGSYVVAAGVSHPLVVPSGMETGVKLNHEFDIVAGTRYELLLDFDADHSIHVTGNGTFMMNPVIRVSAIEATGSIRGVVLPAAANTTVWTTEGADTIAAQADAITGVFVLSGLGDGIYDLQYVPGSASYRDTTMGGIIVLHPMQTYADTMVLRPQ